MDDTYMVTSVTWHCGCGQDHHMYIIGDSSGAADLASAALADQYRQGIRPTHVQAFACSREQLDGFFHEELATCRNVAPDLLDSYKRSFPSDHR